MINILIAIDNARKKGEEARNKRLKNKTYAFKELIKTIDQPIETLLKKYTNEKFLNTDVLKNVIFEHTINMELHRDDIEFLNEAVKGLGHNKDKREPYEYAIDLMLGWLIEDAVVNKVSEQNIPVILCGADASREFLKKSDIDSSPDIKIGSEENFRLVEVFCDWTDYWTLKGKADLRDNKYKRLEDDNAILLGLSPLSSTGFLMNITKDSNDFVYNDRIVRYGKPGYTCDNISKHIQPINEVFNQLYNIFK